MPKIITITFNPSIDKSTSVELITPDIKLTCAIPKYEPGGGGINVARAIKKLGGEATAVYLAGGCSGLKFNELMKDESINTVITETKNNTRENLVIVEMSTKRQFRFGIPGLEVYQPEWKALLRSIEKINDIEYIVTSGSLPEGIPVDIFGRIARIARKKGAKLIVDTAGDALSKAVEVGVFLIKPNLREMCSLVGLENQSIESIGHEARNLMNKGSCHAVVVSLGGDGALLFTKDLFVRITPPKVDVKSTVGAGDSMVAGIVLSLLKNKTLLDAVKYGVA